MSKGAATKKVRLTDLAKGVVDMIPSAPLMLRHAPGLIHRPADAKKTIGSVFQGHAGAHPERPFVRFEGATTTYGEANTIVSEYNSNRLTGGMTISPPWIPGSVGTPIVCDYIAPPKLEPGPIYVRITQRLREQ